MRAAWQHFEQLCLSMASQLLEESFRKLVDHMRQMDLEVARDAAMQVQKSHFGGRRVQPGRSIASHMFRMPHGASTERSDLSKESSISAVSDLSPTKPLDEADMEADVSSSTWLVMTDSHSGYLQRCLLRCKS